MLTSTATPATATDSALAVPGTGPGTDFGAAGATGWRDAHDGSRWHGYFLKAAKALGDPDLRHFNVSQGHAVSDDLVSWDHLGTCLRPSAGSAFDDRTTP